MRDNDHEQTVNRAWPITISLARYIYIPINWASCKSSVALVSSLLQTKERPQHMHTATPYAYIWMYIHTKLADWRGKRRRGHGVRRESTSNFEIWSSRLKATDGWIIPAMSLYNSSVTLPTQLCFFLLLSFVSFPQLNALFFSFGLSFSFDFFLFLVNFISCSLWEGWVRHRVEGDGAKRPLAKKQKKRSRICFGHSSSRNNKMKWVKAADAWQPADEWSWKRKATGWSGGRRNEKWQTRPLYTLNSCINLHASMCGCA